MTDFGKTIAKETAMKDPNNLSQWKQDIDELETLLKPITKARQLHINKSNQSLCPYITFATFDALDERDYPNGIQSNSVFIRYLINLYEKKVCVHYTGHVWLSPKDKETPRYRHMAMKGIEDVLTDKGGKKFRKQKFKSMKDLATRMEKHYREVMQAVGEYTGGYPYKQGIEEAA